MGNAKDSADAYEQAAKALPANAGMYYFNEAATLYNAARLPEAEAAADKAIAADPKKADAYYIKGQALIPQATVDPKTQKIVAPPGCVEAYQTVSGAGSRWRRMQTMSRVSCRASARR